MFEIKNSVALITGGASGIGLSLAKQLLYAGAKGIAIVDIDKNGEQILQKILNEFGRESAIFIMTDVTDAKQLEAAFEATVKTFNQLDMVFNNAGVVNEIDWESSILVNLTACIRGTKLAIEKYIPKYSSKIDPIVVNTSSKRGLIAYTSMPVYCAGKTGIISYTRAMGDRYEMTKIRVIGICPGATKTSILQSTVDNVEEPYRKMNKHSIDTQYYQSPDILASHVINILSSAPSGSIYRLERDDIFKVEFHKYC